MYLKLNLPSKKCYKTTYKMSVPCVQSNTQLFANNFLKAKQQKWTSAKSAKWIEKTLHDCVHSDISNPLFFFFTSLWMLQGPV